MQAVMHKLNMYIKKKRSESERLLMMLTLVCVGIMKMMNIKKKSHRLDQSETDCCFSSLLVRSCKLVGSLSLGFEVNNIVQSDL